MSKVMIVTGGSRGIGAAIARLAGAKGYDVAVNYAQAKDRAEEVAADIEKAGQRAIAVQADMGKEGDILRMLETVDNELGPVSAIVNNARDRLRDVDPRHDVGGAGARLRHQRLRPLRHRARSRHAHVHQARRQGAAPS